jgi:Ca2+/Na+ antiporter
LKRIEPNLLLALATAVPLALLVATASLFGEPGNTLKYVLLAVICSVLFVVLNGMLAKRMGTQRPPMIHPEAASTAVWASLFPMLLILAAAIPVFFSGHDYGLLVIIGAVWFGVTVQSALKARQAG